jgi:proline utilization trans-activator
LPSKAEAQRLVRIVHFYIGQTQSYYDPRVFSDRLEAFYADQNDQEHTKTLWFLQMLIVLALGKLITGDFDADSESFELPGEKLFNFAVKNIPTLADLYVHGSLAVEVLALAALYSQNIDRQGEAYVYVRSTLCSYALSVEIGVELTKEQISTALRLAVTHGFHRQTGTHRLILSERVQLNRLWWTVYIQERYVGSC